MSYPLAQRLAMTDASVSCPRCGKLRALESFVSAAGRTLKSCEPCRETAKRIHRRRRERIGPARSDGTPPAVAFKLVVDHCHTTRRVRGLLCVGCNAAIGHFRDDVATVESALAYLRAAAGQPI